MQKNKYAPGFYLLNNTAVIELAIKDSNYLITLLFKDPAIKAPFSSSGTEISFNTFESILNTHGKELIPVDPTKAEVLNIIYG